MAGLVRLVHPFPIALDALATTAVGLIAGGSVATALRLGVAMLCLQAAIGALNDLVDAPRDAGHKPGKPIPAGLVGRRSAAAVAAATAFLGLVLSVPSGPPTVVLAALILAVGAAYDLRLKGTAWSWLPFAIGIPLLPVYAWLGASGTLPGAFGVLLPAAFLAGAALAIANALVDVERDRGANVTSIAGALGARRAWRVHVLLLAATFGLAAVSLAAWGRAPDLAALVLGPPTVLVAAGGALLQGAEAGRRERGWELEAVGIAVLAGTWLAFGVPR